MKFFACLLLLWSVVCSALAAPIERVEPRNWWVGMKNDKLQLMVHGADIADFTPQLNYPGVHIDAVTSVANRNYLFIDLTIARDAQAGQLNLLFKHGGTSFNYPYQLQARENGSAARAGFTSADVILNLMPDRFANGDPSNDNVAGYPDKAKRSDNEAGPTRWRHQGYCRPSRLHRGHGLHLHLAHASGGKQSAGLFLPWLCRHRHLQDRSALWQQ